MKATHVLTRGAPTPVQVFSTVPAETEPSVKMTKAQRAQGYLFVKFLVEGSETPRMWVVLPSELVEV